MNPEEVRSSWMNKTASINIETESNKWWRLTKQLNDEENRHAKLTTSTRQEDGPWETSSQQFC